MQHPPKLVPIVARSDSPVADHRRPYDVSAAQVPLVNAVLDWLAEPIAYIDRDLRIRLANAAFAEAAGVARDELIDRHLRDTTLANHCVDIEAGLLIESREFTMASATGPTWRMSTRAQHDEFGSVRGCLILPADASAAARARELEGLIQAMPGPACLIDDQRRYVFMNPTLAREAAFEVRDAMGRPVSEMVPPQVWADMAPHLDRALAGEYVEYERLAPLPDGSERWVSRTLVPRRAEDGRVTGTYAFGRDTHNLRIAQDELLTQREALRGLLDSMPLPVGYLDVDSRFTLVNRPFCALTGRDEAALVGAHFNDIVASPATSEGSKPADYAQRGAVAEFELLMPSTDGSEVWRRFRLVPRRDPVGQIHGVYVIVLDIHEEKLARVALERRERQVREFADNIPQPVAYLEPDDRFGRVNKAFAQLVALPSEQIVGRTLAEVFGTTSAIAVNDLHARVRAGEAVNEERMLALPNGDRRLVEIRWSPEVEFNADGTSRGVRGLYLMIVDTNSSDAARAAYEESVAELRRAMSSIDTPVALVDTNECFRFANASMQAWYGLPGEQMVGRDLRSLFGDKLYAKSRPYIERALGGEQVLFERVFLFPGGVERWTRVRYVPQRGDHGRVTGFYIVVFDVHDLKIQQRELQVKQEELRRANWLLSSHLENSPLAALELDADLNIRRWSERAERLFGWRRDSALNRSIWELSLIADGEVDAITRSFALVLSARQQRVSALQRITRQDGSRIWCEWYISALADETGEVASIFALVQDVNQRVEAEARLQQLAAFDSLTGLPNRSSLQFELAQALDRARRSKTGAAALFIDLDHFKNVNDTLGHRIGDQLLLAVARILKSCVRKGDVVSRMGGDEFMVVVEHQDARTASSHVANKILVALNQPIPVEGHMLTVAASVGIALFPDHGADANMLLKNSDVAMYHAKELGKGRFEFYSDELAREREEQALIEFSLRVAMASNQLVLAYQPRVALEDGRIEGAEALLRWRHPELGDIPPKKFIRVAEETGLIFELGTWVFRKACQQLREWEREGLPIRTVSVNFSARQLLTRDLIDRISMILAETGCDPRRIEIEITETSMMFDVTTTKRVITSLKRLGMRIAIDDFGTGFSSLSHLQQLDIDALKIDQSFIRDLLLDAGDAAITRAVIALGRGIGLQVIAEGVENARQLSFLRDCGCDLYQGFHFSPAVAPKDFELLVKSQQGRIKPALTRI